MVDVHRICKLKQRRRVRRYSTFDANKRAAIIFKAFSNLDKSLDETDKSPIESTTTRHRVRLQAERFKTERDARVQRTVLNLQCSALWGTTNTHNSDFLGLFQHLPTLALEHIGSFLDDSREYLQFYLNSNIPITSTFLIFLTVYAAVDYIPRSSILITLLKTYPKPLEKWRSEWMFRKGWRDHAGAGELPHLIYTSNDNDKMPIDKALRTTPTIKGLHILESASKIMKINYKPEPPFLPNLTKFHFRTFSPVASWILANWGHQISYLQVAGFGKDLELLCPNIKYLDLTMHTDSIPDLRCFYNLQTLVLREVNVNGSLDMAKHGLTVLQKLHLYGKHPHRKTPKKVVYNTPKTLICIFAYDITLKLCDSFTNVIYTKHFF
jgi:hypothetical protein